jgi:hypothetical protein
MEVNTQSSWGGGASCAFAETAPAKRAETARAGRKAFITPLRLNA